MRNDNRSESYNGNANIKKEGIEQSYTQAQLTEYLKCSNDPKYFAQTYIKVIHPDHGLVPFNLYDYQKEMFDHFNNNLFNIVLACRQSGKSISSCAYLLWYCCFHSDKYVAILANKHATAKEMLSRITLMLENLPFFLQPGCKTLNKNSIEFDNETTLMAAATSKSSIRGFTINLLYLDEFAFVEDAATFYTSTYPVITAGVNSRVIITSTANGIGNMFHRLWTSSIQKTNTYEPFRVDWWDVPGRDEGWKERTIANTSQLQFDQEYGNTFFGTGHSLINAQTLMGLRAQSPIEEREGGLFRIYNLPTSNHEYMLFADVSKGRGQDYSTFSVIDISSRPFKQVAVYRNNTISPILFPDVIYKYAKLYNNAYVVIEANDQGALVANGLYYDHEYEELHQTHNKSGKASHLGVEINRKIKRIGCSGFKDVLESGRLDIVDEHTIMEVSTFEAKGQSFEASDNNHDDIVMNLVLFGYIITTMKFAEMTDINIKEVMYKQRMAEIEDDVPSWGFHSDGLEDASNLDLSDSWSVKDAEDVPGGWWSK
jgi:hypothetical protein